MHDLGTVLRLIREERGWTQPQLAFHAEGDPSSVSRHERGQPMRTDLLERYMQAANAAVVVTPAGWSVYAPPTQELPYYGRVPCGVPLLIEEAAPEQVDLADLTAGTWHDGHSYMVQADGDSMELAIRDGDWLVVRRYGNRAPRLWDIAVAVVEGETVIAQVRPHPERDDWRTLGKLNERYAVTLDDGDDVRLIGHVVGSLRWRPMRE